MQTKHCSILFHFILAQQIMKRLRTYSYGNYCDVSDLIIVLDSVGIIIRLKKPESSSSCPNSLPFLLQILFKEIQRKAVPAKKIQKLTGEPNTCKNTWLRVTVTTEILKKYSIVEGRKGWFWLGICKGFSRGKQCLSWALTNGQDFNQADTEGWGGRYYRSRLAK